MKVWKDVAVGIGIVLLVGAFLGCASSLPTTQEARALLVIPVVAKGSNFFANYVLIIGDQEVKVIARSGLTLADTLPPGEHRVSGLVVVGRGMTTSDIRGQKVRPLDIPFTLKAGAITVLPATLEIKIVTRGDGSMTQSHGWVDTDRGAVVNALQKYENYAMWDVAE